MLSVKPSVRPRNTAEPRHAPYCPHLVSGKIMTMFVRFCLSKKLSGNANYGVWDIKCIMRLGNKLFAGFLLLEEKQCLRILSLTRKGKHINMICQGRKKKQLKLKYEAKGFLKILGPAVVFWFCFLSQFCFHSPQLFHGNRLSHFVSVASLVSDVIYSQGSVLFEILSGGAKGGLKK